MTTRAKLTVRLPTENLEFVKRYAAENGVTVTDVLNRFLTRLRHGGARSDLHPSVERLRGLLPADLDTPDGRDLYHEHLLDKHR
jgi:hypothetical protein